MSQYFTIDKYLSELTDRNLSKYKGLEYTVGERNISIYIL